MWEGVVLVVCAVALLVVNQWILQQIWRRWYAQHSLATEVVLVTGAGSGIGRHIAYEAAACGASVVVLVDVSKLGMEETARMIRAKQQRRTPSLLSFVCDVSDAAAVANMAAQVRAAVAPRHVSVLVNNAGIVSGKPILDLLPADVQRTMSVNCLAHFWTIREFLPDMERTRRGAVVAVSSSMALVGGARLTDYCASKSAVVGLMESLRLELKARRVAGVRTLIVAPFVVDTGMFQGAFAPETDIWLRRLFFPRLNAKALARRIVTAIVYRETLLVAPWVLRYIIAVARFLPTQLLDFGLSLMGGTHAMDAFVGHQRQKNEFL